MLQKIGSPTGNLEARLYTAQGTYGTDNIPTDACYCETGGCVPVVLATSDTLDSSTVGSVDFSWYTFTFPANEQTYLQANVVYIIVLHAVSETFNVDNNIRIGAVTGADHGGNMCTTRGISGGGGNCWWYNSNAEVTHEVIGIYGSTGILIGDYAFDVVSLRIKKSVEVGEYNIKDRNRGEIDTDLAVRNPDEFEIIVDVNDIEKRRLESLYLKTIRVMGDFVDPDRFSETAEVERIECEYQTGHGFWDDKVWRCTLSLVLSNS